MNNLNGYYKNSPWPVECGGNKRQKIVSNGVLNSKDKKPKVITKINNRWNVMFVHRNQGELFLGGTMPSFIGPKPFGWIQKINPDDLSVLKESPKLKCGDHIWCGAIAVNQDGNILKVNGSYVHLLDNNCNVIKEKKLSVNQAHNGFLILSDNTLITKDIRLANDKESTLTRLDSKTLETIGDPLTLPEPSMGRIASLLEDGIEYIYIPGKQKIWRVIVHNNKMEIDYSWNPLYRYDDKKQGLAWDGCISDDSIWFMDNGDIETVRTIFSENPNGRFESFPQTLDWRLPAPWEGKVRLLRFNIKTGEKYSYEPFSQQKGGIIAPPLNISKHKLCIVWDSINGGIAGISYNDNKFEKNWEINIRPTMQPIYFEQSNELVINHFDDKSDYLVVIDVLEGKILSKVNLRTPMANGMFLTPGFNNDVLYCSTLAISKVSW